MPKKVADLLDIEYELVTKGVVQLDGTSIRTAGVVKNLKLSLHA